MHPPAGRGIFFIKAIPPAARSGRAQSLDFSQFIRLLPGQILIYGQVSELGQRRSKSLFGFCQNWGNI
jgi:hypothetical protein